MKLRDVARSFNNMLCLDGYTGMPVFAGQLGLYDDNKRDSETAGRRVISLSEEDALALPARRVVAAAGTRFILGHANPDDYRGSTIRVGIVAQEAPHLASVLTLAQVCLAEDGFQAYVGRAWVKDLAYSEQSSVKTPEHHVHFAAVEPVEPGMLVAFDTRWHLVRSTNYGAGGTLVASCELMAEPAVESAVATTGTYNPSDDSLTPGTVLLRVVRMRWQSLFAYRNGIAPKFEPGDIQLAIAKAALTVKAGTVVSLSDGEWNVQSAVDEGSVWLCRATRHV